MDFAIKSVDLISPSVEGAIEVLKQLKENPCGLVDIHEVGMDPQTAWTEASISDELEKAIDEALLALEQKKALLEWVDDCEKTCSNEVERTLFGRLVGTCKIRDILKHKGVL